jgi:xanthine dehydrogenase accessory factor
VTPRPADSWRIVQRATELAAAGVEFALATVVWRQAPSSGHQGARAIITREGEIHGWIGGACAEPVVIREARQAIIDKQPRLILLGTPDHFRDIPEGMTFVPMSCQSEGAMELYIEPVTPNLNLVVVGNSPMAGTLVQLADVLGWETKLVDPPHFTTSDVNHSSVVVVATQGHGDEEAIEQALAGEPAFVGLVASKKRGESVLGYLQDRGVPQQRLERVTVPVGLDLGHTSHSEIAVAVLAQLVELRARGALDAPAEPHSKQAPSGHTDHPAPHVTAGTAIDPVCGMTVAADASSRPFEYDGDTYYFCCPGCRAAFEKDPASFVTKEALS